MIKKPRFIIISGIDGTGKTTLANWLVEFYKSKGYKCKYIRIRYRHTLSYLIMRLLIFLGWHKNFRNANGVCISRFEVYDSTFAKKVWPFIEFISILPLIIFKVMIPYLLGYRLVCDRYTIDTIVSVALETRNMHFTYSLLGALLLKMIPKKSVIIFLDADSSTVLERRPDIEYTINEIESGVILYRSLAKKMKAFSINVSIYTIEQVRKRVFSLLFTK